LPIHIFNYNPPCFIGWYGPGNEFNGINLSIPTPSGLAGRVSTNHKECRSHLVTRSLQSSNHTSPDYCLCLSVSHFTPPADPHATCKENQSRPSKPSTTPRHITEHAFTYHEPRIWKLSFAHCKILKHVLKNTPNPHPSPPAERASAPKHPTHPTHPPNTPTKGQAPTCAARKPPSSPGGRPPLPPPPLPPPLAAGAAAPARAAGPAQPPALVLTRPPAAPRAG